MGTIRGQLAHGHAGFPTRKKRCSVFRAALPAACAVMCVAGFASPIVRASEKTLPCRPSQLSATEDTKESDRIDGGLGHHALAISLHNRSMSSCALQGVAEITLLDADGRSLSVPVCANCNNYLFGKQTAQEIRLAPKESAYVFIEYDINDNLRKWPCRQSASLGIHLPGQRGSLRVATGGEMRSCGTVNVTPFLRKPSPSQDR